MDKQTLRNALTEIEDAARQRRNRISNSELRELHEAFNLIARLTQLVRENIVQ